MAGIARKAKKYRYADDPREITLDLSYVEATMLLAAIDHADVDDDSLVDVKAALKAVLTDG